MQSLEVRQMLLVVNIIYYESFLCHNLLCKTASNSSDWQTSFVAVAGYILIENHFFFVNSLLILTPITILFVVELKDEEREQRSPFAKAF